jgi:hypothetical protein
MTIVRELIALLGVEVDEGAFRAANEALVGLKVALTGLAAATAAGAGLAALVRHASEVGRETSVLADRLGVTTDQLQELRFIGERFSLSLASIETGLRQLEIAAVKASQGNATMAQAFAKAGISVKDAAGQIRPSVDLMRDLADAMAKARTPAERTALAVQLFGRTGEKFLPFLKDGAKGFDAMRERAHALGLVISEDAVKSLVELNAQFNEVESSVKSSIRTFSVGLVPSFREVLTAITDWRIRNKDLVDSGIRGLSAAAAQLAQLFLRTVVPAILRSAEIILVLASAFERNEHFAKLMIVPLTSIGVSLTALSVSALASIPAVAGLTAALAPLALELGAVIAISTSAVAAIDELSTYLDGGKTLLGELFFRFLDRPGDPADTFMTKAFREALRALRALIEGVEIATAKLTDLFSAGAPGASAEEQALRAQSARRAAEARRQAQRAGDVQGISLAPTFVGPPTLAQATGVSVPERFQHRIARVTEAPPELFVPRPVRDETPATQPESAQGGLAGFAKGLGESFAQEVRRAFSDSFAGVRAPPAQIVIRPSELQRSPQEEGRVVAQQIEDYIAEFFLFTGRRKQ